MFPRLSRRTFFSTCLAAALPAVSVGCGTVLHPERRGQGAGRLDWSIVALNAIGLFFFFIPGVIAFAVDFSNGTIYLPPDYPTSPGGTLQPPLQTYSLSPGHRSARDIERFVSEKIGQDVQLEDPRCFHKPLEHIDQFHAAHEQMLALHVPADEPLIMRAQDR